LDLVKHLKKQFHNNKSLFQHCFGALNFQATPPMAVIDILDRISILEDAFKIDNFNIDQDFICGAKRSYLSNKTHLFSRLLLKKKTIYLIISKKCSCRIYCECKAYQKPFYEN